MNPYNRPISLLCLCCYITACSGQFAQKEQTRTEDVPTPFDVTQIASIESELDDFITSSMRNEHLPGAAIAIVHNGKTIVKSGYGFADVSNNRKVDPDKTLFRIGSVSKVMTTLAFARLIDQKQIDLDDAVAEYLPELNQHSIASKDLPPITIEHLLTHTAGLDQVGIGRHVWHLDKSLEERKAMRPDISTFLLQDNLRRVNSPGEYFRYDTYGITVAGAVLEGITGKSYAEAMHTVLFEPLKMQRSFVEVQGAMANDLAIGYGYNLGKYSKQPYEVYVTTPASSVDMTVADMSLLLETITGDGANQHGRFVSATMADAITSPQFRPHPDFPGITHGLWESMFVGRDARFAVRTVGHGGNMLGYQSSLTILPEIDLAIFIVVNRDPEAGGGNVTLPRAITEKVLELLHYPQRDTDLVRYSTQKKVEASEYVGNYYWGVYCHTCTSEEFENGAWQQGNPIKVSSFKLGLKIDENYFVPTGEKDVFAQKDSWQKAFFGRDENQNVTFFVFNDSPDTFERH